MADSKRPAVEVLERNARFLKDVSAHDDFWIVQRSGVVNIYGNFDNESAKRMGACEKIVQLQFAQKFEIDDETLRAINDYVLAKHEGVRLWLVLNGYHTCDDTDCVRQLPNLQSLKIDAVGEVDFSPIVEHERLSEIILDGRVDISSLVKRARSLD